MDEVRNTRLIPQSSVCSDSNGEEVPHSGYATPPSSPYNRICLLGDLSKDSSLLRIAHSFGIPIVMSEDGKEFVDNSFSTVFILDSFENDNYKYLHNSKKQVILGPTALKQLANKNEILPKNIRPLYNLAMTGVILAFTGFKEKAELGPLVSLVHHMGASIRKEMSARVTHLIAKCCGGEKYQYATTFRLPVMHRDWVFNAWENKLDVEFSATNEEIIAKHKLKPFYGLKVCFYGFAEDEEKHMTEILLANGGNVTNLDDNHCTHVVMERSEVYTFEATSATPLTTPQKQSPVLVPPITPKNPDNFLETLHENNDLSDIDFDHTLNKSIFNSNRKRKLSHCSTDQEKFKRKRDKSFSEKKRKVSEFFKTPVNYFSQRRRTIDSTNLNQTTNSSVMSSSGVFTVDTLNNLTETPTNSFKTKRKNLFTRTFSTSKFKKKHKTDLNSTRLSFGCNNDNSFECGTSDKFNNSCFPNFSHYPPNHLLRSDYNSKQDLWLGSSCAVVDEASVEKPDANQQIFVVKSEWFWLSVQKEFCLNEKDYLYDDYVELMSPNNRRESHQTTPSSASRRKRKRLPETLLSLATYQHSPCIHKRRSSVSDAGLLSVSGSFLDCTTSPDNKALVDGTVSSSATVEAVVDTPRKALTKRQQVFLELVQTETNYVDILHTIITMFKKHLEEMPEEEALLNNTELNLIFGKLPPIYETHVKMLNDLRYLSVHWSEEHSIGNIILRFSTELLKAYPPFINYFEEMKEVLQKCDQNKPRFHAFLKACQTKPECGRQSLQDLIIRPVQRLGSISLLLNDILKNTPKVNPDHAALDQALAALREVMTHINEDKRKAEGQVILFNIFNEIDNCPPDIVSSHRNFITKTEVIQRHSTHSEILSNRGNNLMLFLFSDQLEICKKKSKSFNSLKSPTNVAGSSGTLISGTTSNSLQRSSIIKPFKHIKLIPLNTIKYVIDIKETEQCKKIFSLVFNDETKDKIYSFAMIDDVTDKTVFLKTLTRQMANNACTPDADKFIIYLEGHQLDIESNDINNGTLSKAFKFASRTKLKVGRAFSFNKTPSKLKRAVSSMMSPFGSSTNITPSNQLAQMRLASYNNINELGNAENATDTPVVIAPMSVQPTRKMNTASLNENALKRL